MIRSHAQHEILHALHAKAHARMLMLAQGCHTRVCVCDIPGKKLLGRTKRRVSLPKDDGVGQFGFNLQLAWQASWWRHQTPDCRVWDASGKDCRRGCDRARAPLADPCLNYVPVPGTLVGVACFSRFMSETRPSAGLRRQPPAAAPAAARCGRTRPAHLDGPLRVVFEDLGDAALPQVVSEDSNTFCCLFLKIL